MRDKKIDECLELLNEFALTTQNRPTKLKIREALKIILNTASPDIKYVSVKSEDLRINRGALDKNDPDTLTFLRNVFRPSNVTISDIPHSDKYVTYKVDNISLDMGGYPYDTGHIYIVDASQGAGGRNKSGSIAQGEVLNSLVNALGDIGLASDPKESKSNKEGEQSTDVVIVFVTPDGQKQTINVEVKNNNKSGKEINFFDKTHVDRRQIKAPKDGDKYTRADDLILNMSNGKYTTLSDIENVKFSESIPGTNKMTSGYISRDLTFEPVNLINVLRDHWQEDGDQLFAINTPAGAYVWSATSSPFTISGPTGEITFPPFDIDSIVAGSVKLKTYGGFKKGNSNRVRAQVTADVKLDGYELRKSIVTLHTIAETIDLMKEFIGS